MFSLAMRSQAVILKKLLSKKSSTNLELRSVSYDGSTPLRSIALAENRAVVESCYKSIPPTTFFSILTIYSKLTLPGVGSTPASGISLAP